MPAALVLAGGLLLGDSLHGSLSGAVVVAAAAGGLWWLSRGKAKIQPRLPSSWSGWIERCDGLVNQFERLQPTENGPAVSAQQENIAGKQAKVSGERIKIVKEEYGERSDCPQDLQ